MTLPTRPDGGIDWRGFVLRVCVNQRDYTVFLVRPTPNYKPGEETRLSYLYPHEIGPAIAAHERERCARLAEAPDGPDPEGNIAAAIRGMED